LCFPKEDLYGILSSGDLVEVDGGTGVLTKIEE